MTRRSKIIEALTSDRAVVVEDISLSRGMKTANEVLRVTLQVAHGRVWVGIQVFRRSLDGKFYPATTYIAVRVRRNLGLLTDALKEARRIAKQFRATKGGR